MAKKSYNVTLSPVTAERLERIANDTGLSFSSSIDLVVSCYVGNNKMFEKMGVSLDDISYFMQQLVKAVENV